MDLHEVMRHGPWKSAIVRSDCHSVSHSGACGDTPPSTEPRGVADTYVSINFSGRLVAVRVVTVDVARRGGAVGRPRRSGCCRAWSSAIRTHVRVHPPGLVASQ